MTGCQTQAQRHTQNIQVTSSSSKKKYFIAHERKNERKGIKLETTHINFWWRDTVKHVQQIINLKLRKKMRNARCWWIGWLSRKLKMQKTSHKFASVLWGGDGTFLISTCFMCLRVPPCVVCIVTKKASKDVEKSLRFELSN